MIKDKREKYLMDSLQILRLQLHFFGNYDFISGGRWSGCERITWQRLAIRPRVPFRPLRPVSRSLCPCCLILSTQTQLNLRLCLVMLKFLKLKFSFLKKPKFWILSVCLKFCFFAFIYKILNFIFLNCTQTNGWEKKIYYKTNAKFFFSAVCAPENTLIYTYTI